MPFWLQGGQRLLQVSSLAAMAASALPADSELQGMTTLQELLDYLAVPDGLWAAFLQQVGDPGHSVRLVAALPKPVIVQGAVQASTANGSGFSSVQAAHVGLFVED